MGLDIYFRSSNKNRNVGYFRKLNALTNWIRMNVSDFDNCQNILLEKEHLISLKETLEQLTPDNCSELFPTEEGFFFGSTDYDEWYWDKVKELQQWLEKNLSEFDFEKEKIIFHAWW